jgi:hypothetical protein
LRDLLEHDDRLDEPEQTAAADPEITTVDGQVAAA